MKVVINNTYGGFGLNVKGMLKYAERKGLELHFYESKFPDEGFKKMTATQAEKSFCPMMVTKDLGKELDRDTFNEKAKDCWLSSYEIERNDPDLIFLVETYGDTIAGDCAKLKVVEVPDDVDYEIEEYDGNEWVAEKHRTWS